jgi:NADH-quinone oxidoreductase subunit J
MGAQFLGAAQILIYAGAIMVLFLFAVTLLAPREDPVLRGGHPGRLAGLVVGIAVAGLLGGFLALASFSPARPSALDGTSQGFARAILGPFVFPFEATALVLLTALLGVVVLGLGALTGPPREPADG